MAMSTASQDRSIDYFQVKLREVRPSAKNGNVELYSLNNSFRNHNVLWKVRITPTTSTKIKGSIKKKKIKYEFGANDICKNIDERLLFAREEAERALRGIFFNAEYVEWIERQNLPAYDVRPLNEIEFTVSDKPDANKLLSLVNNPDFPKSNCTIPGTHNTYKNIKMGNPMKTNTYLSIHGLLNLSSPLSLEQCTAILEKHFPNFIAWLSYCPHPSEYADEFGIEYP